MSQTPTRGLVERSWLPWLALGLTFAVLTLMMIVSVRDWSYRASGRAAAYVPADGQRSSDGVGADGRVWENATIAGDPGLGLVPESLARQLGELQQTGLGPFQLWWRSTMITGSDADLSRLLAVRNNGLWLQARYDRSSSEAYAPGLPLQPADAELGQTWTQTGDVVDAAGNRRSYELTGRLLPATDPAYAGKDCLATEHTLAVGADPARSERYVLCRGAGLVDVLSAGQSRTVITAYRRPSSGSVPEPRPASNPTTWTAATSTVPVQLSARDLAVTAGDRLVGSAGGEADLIGWRRATDAVGGRRWDLTWVRRPGGRILTIAASGRTVLVTTDRRTVVAYDETGRWLWTQDLGELSRAGTAPVTSSRFVVALLDGTVQLRRVDDGAPIVADKLPGALLTRPVASPAGDMVYVADDSGTLRAYGSDGAPRWEEPITAGRVQLRATSTGVVVHTGSDLGLLTAGHWQWRLTTGLGALDVLADRVLLARTDGLLALDLADGDLTWRRPDLSVDVLPTRDPLTVVGTVAVVAEAGRLVAIDAAGSDVAALTVPNTIGLELVTTPAGGGSGITAWSGTRDDVTVWGPDAPA